MPLLAKVFIAAFTLILAASIAGATVDPDNSWVYTLCDPAVILVAPGGAESFVFPDNCLIEVYLNDEHYWPVELPAADIWLENEATVPCPGGWIADSSTYAPDEGHTTFSGTPLGGVAALAPCRDTGTVLIAGGQEVPFSNTGEWSLRFVSPDLDGNGDVGVGDFGLFGTICYNQPCSDEIWCANFNRSDETEPEFCVETADFAIFASFFNLSHCP